MNFTVEEINLIAIYKTDTLSATIDQISEALPDMDSDMRVIARSASRKLAALTALEFSVLLFSSYIPAIEILPNINI